MAKANHEGKEIIEISGLWLRVNNSRIEVLIEVNGVWAIVNDEPLAAPISHITEAAGMKLAPIDRSVSVAH